MIKVGIDSRIYVLKFPCGIMWKDISGDICGDIRYRSLCQVIVILLVTSLPRVFVNCAYKG